MLLPRIAANWGGYVIGSNDTKNSTEKARGTHRRYCQGQTMMPNIDDREKKLLMVTFQIGQISKCHLAGSTKWETNRDIANHDG
jgi:hypothetical protein